MYKLSSLLSLLLLTSSTAFAAADANQSRISPEHYNCQELMAFASGAYDSSPVLLGVQRQDWNYQTRTQIVALTNECQQISLRAAAKVAPPHTLILPTFTDQQGAAVIAKADDIWNTNRAHEQQLKKQREDDAVKAERDAYEAEQARHASMRKAVENCHQTRESLFQQSEYEITSYVQDLIDLHKSQQYQAEVVQVSGVHNYREEREIGEGIVDTTHKMQQSFANYKRLGGKAATPQQVTMTVKDPCAELQATELKSR